MGPSFVRHAPVCHRRRVHQPIHFVVDVVGVVAVEVGDARVEVFEGFPVGAFDRLVDWFVLHTATLKRRTGGAYVPLVRFTPHPSPTGSHGYWAGNRKTAN